MHKSAKVHVAGGVEIGGVLEPVLATTTVVDDTEFPDDALHDLGAAIIEDNCFIGARAVITDGVIVEKGSVVATGTFIDPSTLYDRTTDEITCARIPAGSVGAGYRPQSLLRCHRQAGRRPNPHQIGH